MTDTARRRARADRRARARRLLAWSVLAGCFLLGFFHRFAPATFADALSTDLDVTDAQLGALASWHFWTYTAAQIPAGLLVDRYGTRRCVAVGSTVTALGALLLAVAQNLVTASAGPLLTGAGLSVVFVGIMKFNAAWFSPERYGLVTGVTMLLATCGAVAAGSPTAWLLEHFHWRALFAVAAAAGLALSLAVAALVRNHPSDAAPAEAPADRGGARGGLRDAFRSRALWPLLLATAGTNGTFYAFSGLWGVPLLTDTRGLSNTAAAWYTTAALTVYGIGCLAIGVWSDRAGRRKPFVLGTSAMALTGWACLALLPWDAGWQGLALYALVGAAASQVTVSFAALKEAVPAHIAATALAILNAGCFGVSAALQPLFGLVLDAGHGWDWALALMAGTSALGLLAARASRETFCRPLAPADSPAALEAVGER
ncbi:MFS transporter [Streptomyces sp. WMMC897]|uniref:MFS transporter n=1 Tax=Streptomyces sp. WMMC897 TaxID=3014782 RepID=UPI0022B633D8|nr:MFS transporter [Streptomyces sp. WMMC897]MCZ7416908.1 MFS transporter [Streptomyces sp. WMMC897]